MELTAVAVPEPSSTALLGLAGLALIMRRRK
ncbi:PEP-CTERM sorting domain-containing protein [bacterium]|nr:PEP-CTERM sorting domain-containing protein [bacterium]